MFGIKCKYNKNYPELKTGFTVVEILIVMAVFIVISVVTITFFVIDTRLSNINKMRIKAMSLAEEGIEIVRFVRDNQSWASTLATFNLGSAYHPITDGYSWSIVLGSENIDDFTRSIIFNAVSRDANDNIENTYNPANNDADTRRVIVNISWADRGKQLNESLSTYLTNWR